MTEENYEQTAADAEELVAEESDQVVTSDPTFAEGETEEADDLEASDDAVEDGTREEDAAEASDENARAEGEAEEVDASASAGADGDATGHEGMSVEELLSAPGEEDYEELEEGIEADSEEDLFVYDADREDAAERLRLAQLEASLGRELSPDEVAPGGGVRNMSELMSIIEALIFVAEEPLPVKAIAEVLDEERAWVGVAVEELAREFNERNGGLMMREVAGGWQIATRPEYHEHVRTYLKSRPTAKLSLAALETLAVIAYKQPITVPEILEIRGVQSSSAIKTLLDKRLIVAKGRKGTVGRPMMYGTSKEFLLQFGLKDLTELPSIEDFEDLATGTT